MKKNYKIITKRVKINKKKTKAFRKKSNSSHYKSDDNGKSRRAKKNKLKIFFATKVAKKLSHLVS